MLVKKADVKLHIAADVAWLNKLEHFVKLRALFTKYIEFGVIGVFINIVEKILGRLL